MWITRFIALAIVLLVPADARPWAIIGGRAPFEADFVGMKGTSVILRGANGNHREFALESFSPEDQVRLFEMELENGRPFSFPKQSSLTSRAGYRTRSLSNPGASAIELEGSTGLTVTDAAASLEGGVNFLSPDAWLFLEKIPASVVLAKWIDRVRVYGAPAVPGKNLRVVQHAAGSVVIPHGEDFPAITAFLHKACTARRCR
jgi:hypothetical protein